MGVRGQDVNKKENGYSKERSMGNLYTQLIRVRSRRVEVLSKLKQAYRTTPRDWELINSLRNDLKMMDDERKIESDKRKGQYG